MTLKRFITSFLKSMLQLFETLITFTLDYDLPFLFIFLNILCFYYIFNIITFHEIFIEDFNIIPLAGRCSLVVY